MKEEREWDDNLNKKIGFLNVAETLYKKGYFLKLERYQNAFDVIKKAVELV